VDQVNGKINGAVESATATATGDTAGDSIEVDTESSSNTLSNTLTDAVAGHQKSIVQAKQLHSFGHRVRILIGYVQITAALVFSFDVPWPPMTLNLLRRLTFINFNFLEFFAPIDPCLMHTPFLSQAAFHMAILPLCGLVVVAAGIVAEACVHKCHGVVWSHAKSVMMTLVFLLYPGIVTRVFTTFKCKTIGDKAYLVADYSVVCWEGQHAAMASAMFVFMGVYVFGIPLMSTLALWRNRALMDVQIQDESEEGGTTPGTPGTQRDPEKIRQAKQFRKVYGSLFEAYDREHWYFESIVMVQKAFLTGGLVLVAPGSSAQILVGLIIALAFFAALLETKPYEEDEEDTMQTIATASTVMTLLIGFTLKIDHKNSVGEESGEYDGPLMDIILVLLFSLVAVSGFFITLKSLPCFNR
jgi:hypothetical protein